MSGQGERIGRLPAYSVEKLHSGAEAIFQFYQNTAENTR
jgi:hypothetical protein